jgi:hypothetical protein
MKCLQLSLQLPLVAVEAVDLVAQVVDCLAEFDEISFGGAACAFCLFSLVEKLLLFTLEDLVTLLAVQKLLPQFVTLTLFVLNLELQLANLVLLLLDRLLGIGVGLVGMV